MSITFRALDVQDYIDKHRSKFSATILDDLVPVFTNYSYTYNHGSIDLEFTSKMNTNSRTLKQLFEHLKDPECFLTLSGEQVDMLNINPMIRSIPWPKKWD